MTLKGVNVIKSKIESEGERKRVRERACVVESEKGIVRVKEKQMIIFYPRKSKLLYFNNGAAGSRFKGKQKM